MESYGEVFVTGERRKEIRGSDMRKTGINKKAMGVLTGFLLISCLCIFAQYIFGNQLLAFTDIGSDTYDQYLMQYQTIIQHLREGSFSLWDFNNGFGTNMYAISLFDPFLLLLYLIGVLFGPSKIYGALVYLQILRIVLAGLSAYCFFSCFRLSERSKVLAAYAYGLCGYMIVWGQHYQFGTVMVMFPLLLMAAEKALKRKKWLLGLTLCCTLSCTISLYMGYMQLVVLGFYILFRTAWEGKICCADGIKKIGMAYGSMILGIGMALFSLLPSAAMIFGVSGRVGGGSLMERLLQNLYPWGKSYYLTLIKQFFTSSPEGINNYRGYGNYYEDSHVFLSALLLFAGTQFVYFAVRKKYALKQKLLLFLAGFLFGFMLLVPLGSMIFNGFAYPFSRHTFLCMPFFAWMMAEGLDEMLEKRRLCIPVLAVSAIGVLFVYLYIFRENMLSMEKNGMKISFLLAGMALGMALCLIGNVCFKKEIFSRLSGAGLILCLMGTMTFDAYYSYNDKRDTLEKAPTEYMNEMYSPSVARALEEIAAEDDSFYRVEKDYTVGTATSCLNSLAQNYAGVSTYNSTLNTGTMEYLQNFWPNLEIINSAHYSFANSVNDDFQASLNHVKYVLSKKSNFQVRGYELYRQVDDIYIYRNTHTQQLGKFYTSAFTEEDYESARESLDRDALLAENVICDTASDLVREKEELVSYQKVPVAQEEEIVQESSDGESILLKLPEMEDASGEKLILEFDISLPRIMPEVQVTAGAHTTEHLVGTEPIPIRVTVPEGCREVKISQPNEVMNGVAVIQNKRLYATPVSDLSSLSDGIRIEACEKDSRIEGSASVSQDGILMLSVPYENGWHAYVDGEETAIQRINYGFSGIQLSEGDHEIVMEYRCPGFLPGVFGSICFALLTGGIWGGWALKNRMKRKRS